MNKSLLLTIVAVAGLDRTTKHLIERSIPIYGGIDVIPGFFRLTHLKNPGAAFSFFADSASQWRGPALIGFSIAALVIISVVLWRKRQQTNVSTIALALIFGGTLGNLWDRVTTGQVTDFLDFYAGSHHWYPFNVADSAIVCGTLVLAANILLHSKKADKVS